MLKPTMKFILFIGFLFIHPLALAGINKVGVPESGVELGLGWDSQRAEIIPNRCIRFAPVKEEGQNIKMKLEEVSDTSELMEKMNVSAGMSINSAVGSGSAQAEFASNTKITSSSNSLFIRATVDNGVLFVGPSQPLDPVRSAYPHKERFYGDAPWWIDNDEVFHSIHLTEDALDLLGDGSAKNIREFERYCGDSFVSAIYSGAELLAVMSIHSDSKSSAKSSMQEVKAHFSAWGAQTDAKLKKEVSDESLNESENISVEFTQIGGSGGIIPTNREDFMTKLHNLPQEAEFGPQFHNMDLVAYSDLPNWPRAILMNTEDDPEEAFLVNYYYTLSSIQHSLQDAIDYPNKYVGKIDIKKLKALQDKVIQHRKNIYKTMQKIYKLAGVPTTIPIFFGLFSKTDKKIVEEKAALEQEELERKQQLIKFNNGYENPNLLKLKLPLPTILVDDCTAKEFENLYPALKKALKNLESIIVTQCKTKLHSLAATAETRIDYFVGKQAQRICQTDPSSTECMSNAELNKLMVCLKKGIINKNKCENIDEETPKQKES